MKNVTKLILLLILAPFLSGCFTKESENTITFNLDETIQKTDAHVDIPIINPESGADTIKPQNSEQTQTTKIAWKLVDYVMGELV